MQIRLAFSQAGDEQFLVTSEFLGELSLETGSVFTVTSFADENEFLANVAKSRLHHSVTVEIIVSVLKMIAERPLKQRWLSLTLTELDYKLLGLKSAVGSGGQALDAGAIDLRDVMLQTPTAFIVMTGPKHRISFMNQANIEILRRTSIDQMLGKPIRQALPELAGQPFFGLLDNVYRTGKPHAGRNVEVSLRNESSGKMDQRFFDFVYYPVRDQDGDVCGIVAQATDVTEQSLARAVHNSREEKLYAQWAELDTIYRHAPIALSLLDAKDYRILRVNDLQAELMGASASELIGQRMMDRYPDLTVLGELYGRVAAGESIHNYEFQHEAPLGSGVMRTWLITLSPSFNETGGVETISSFSIEITDRLELRTSGEAAVQRIA